MCGLDCMWPMLDWGWTGAGDSFSCAVEPGAAHQGPSSCAAFELEFQRHRAVRQSPWRRAHRYLQCMDTFTTDLDVQSHVIYDLPHLHRWSLRKVHKSAPTAPPALSASIVIPQVQLTSAIERPSRAMFQTTPVTPWGLTAVHASTSATASDWHTQMDETSLPVYQTHICG